MAFIYAYSLSDEDVNIKDFTAATALSAKAGDLVTLDTSGDVAAPAANAATVLGVYVGGNFRGITENSPYAATTVTENSQSGKLAKVRVATPDAVFRAPYTGGTPVVGVKYGVTAEADPKIDFTNTATGAIYQVVDLDTDTSEAFVVITGRVLG